MNAISGAVLLKKKAGTSERDMKRAMQKEES